MTLPRLRGVPLGMSKSCPECLTPDPFETSASTAADLLREEPDEEEEEEEDDAEDDDDEDEDEGYSE